MLAHSISFDALGTKWEVSSGVALPEVCLVQMKQRIEDFDKTYSRFRPDSVVTRISQQIGTYAFPEDVTPLLTLYRGLYELSDGRVSPLIGSMLERAGYDAHYRFTELPQQALAAWDEAMTWRGTTLTTHELITLDFGAAGKGYLVDILASILKNHQIADFVIDASGDICHRGDSENHVGLEHPLEPSTVIGVLDVRNQSLCASATNRRSWGSGLHHLFDPTTMQPVKHISATWVIADTTLLADGLATALFFCEPQVLQARYDFAYVRMHTDGSLDYTPSLERDLFV